VKKYGVEPSPMKAELPNESDDAEAPGSEGAAADVLAAFKASDAKALDLALKRHYALCAKDSDDDEDDEPEEV
jgi:hypothetical protein